MQLALLPVEPFVEQERNDHDAPSWWCSADRDGLSRLSLSPDYHPATAGRTFGWNSPGQFSCPQYRSGLHRCLDLLLGGPCAGILVLVRLETSEQQGRGGLSHLSASGTWSTSTGTIYNFG